MVVAGIHARSAGLDCQQNEFTTGDEIPDNIREHTFIRLNKFTMHWNELDDRLKLQMSVAGYFIRYDTPERKKKNRWVNNSRPIWQCCEIDLTVGDAMCERSLAAVTNTLSDSCGFIIIILSIDMALGR